MSQQYFTSKSYYHQSIEDLIKEFNTNIHNGLKSEELEDRYLKYGYNELPKIKKSLWKIYLAPIFNFLIVILIITGAIIIVLGQPESTIITFTVVIINSGTAIGQQYRAQKALESLQKIAALRTTVLRDGFEFEIPTRELIPGDIVLLEQGDKIPADSRIIEYVNLAIDEAPLTGESEPVVKDNRVIEKNDVPIQEQHNMLFMGTYIHTGRVKAMVTGTGSSTEIGKISHQLNEMGRIEDLPLTKKLNRLGYILGTVVIINLIILISYKFSILIAENKFIEKEISQALVDSILRAMNVVPINLPLLATLVLITGVLNMAQSGVIIKNLSAIESLGRVSVICSDKTGTITKNEMSVEKFEINNVEYEVTGAGYDEPGDITKNGKVIDLRNNITFQKFIDSVVINNNAKLVYEDVKVKVGETKEMAIRKAIGSPTEAALLVLAEKAGFISYDIQKKYNIMVEFSFSSEFKRMTVICNSVDNEKQIYAFAKGAPERIINISSQIEINGKVKVFNKKLKKEIINRINRRANQGYRTLAIAYRMLVEVDKPIREEIEEDLIYLGFVSIMDPPRLGVREAVEESQAAGIKVIMVTGDHPATAKTIAAQMRIYKEGDLVVEGKDINNLSDTGFKNVTVFARVAPSDKEIIVEKYQSENKIVAMTGDGINDSLALKMANAGVAMGITGTDVAKETADMVISDDNFISIEEGVKIGRGLFSKIRTIIFFFICLNIMEASVFFSYEFLPFVLFSSNWQHIYIFGIVHSLPSLALVIDTQPKDIMKEPPRNEEELLNKYMWLMLLIQAFLMGIGIVLAIELTRNGIIPLNGWNTNDFSKLSYIPKGTSKQELIDMKARTMFITTLYIIESFFIWTIRRPNKSLIQSIKDDDFSYILLVICLITLSLHIYVICNSYELNNTINNQLGLNFQINFMFLSATDWLICILLALPGLFGIEVFKYFARKKGIIF
ncbi:MAG: cation-transporting P-type ATPase [Promethearchaeota archaeon]|nr:MAG: cation-transporting P-type ATPase [Candidatus Lokiarchaeota archaeon]